MKKRTSLGDFISALYDQVDAGTAQGSEFVTACTLELLLRQGKRNVLAAIFGTPDTLLLH
ncbi:MAG TPA: hypothetical protein VKB80_06990 [Kofleriaceae bacterium]|nr:hypothetical protein [Kofleriaceae bacterium]